jgi:PAS domain S-box-containing protein
MSHPDHPPTDASEPHSLRLAAEATLRNQAADAASPMADPQRLLQELRVHQIELEMQNETLRSTQAALESSRARYVDLYDFAPVGYCTLTEDGTITEINLTAVKLLGQERQHLLGRAFMSLMALQDQPNWLKFFTNLKMNQGSAKLELTLQRPGGTPFQAELDCVAEPLGSQGVTVRVALADISQRVQEQARQRVMAKAVRAVSQGVLIAGPDRRIVSANPAFTVITGFPEADILGRNCSFLQGPLTDLTTVAAIGKNLFAHTEFTGEILNYRQDGTPFWNGLSISPVLDAAGMLTHFAGVTRDVTARKQAELELQANVAEKNALLKEVHHRVKNNLQVITSLLRLEAGRSLHTETQTVLQTMQGRIRAMAHLHESLYRSGTLASVDLGTYLGHLAGQAFQAQQVQAGVVRLRLHMGSVQVGMDQATSCGLLLNELVSNCVKHGFPGGRSGEVAVSLEMVDGEVDAPAAPDGPMWRLCVHDTGVGLPASFETQRTTSLGLQLVGDLCRQIEGTLTITSQADTFTEFSVVFKPVRPTALHMPT